MKKRDRRFNQKILTMGAPLSIETAHLARPRDDEHLHGYFVGGKIVIGDHVPEPLKHTVFMHELLHAVDEQVQGVGVTRRAISHDWIINASPLIVAFLIEAGFWKDGPTLRELDKAMRNERRKDGRSRRRRTSATGGGGT